MNNQNQQAKIFKSNTGTCVPYVDYSNSSNIQPISTSSEPLCAFEIIRGNRNADYVVTKTEIIYRDDNKF